MSNTETMFIPSKHKKNISISRPIYNKNAQSKYENCDITVVQKTWWSLYIFQLKAATMYSK